MTLVLEKVHQLASKSKNILTYLQPTADQFDGSKNFNVQYN